MKRLYRDLDDSTKQKISASLKNRKKSLTHCQAISNGMKEYWKNIPYRDGKNNSDNPDTDDEF